MAAIAVAAASPALLHANPRCPRPGANTTLPLPYCHPACQEKGFPLSAQHPPESKEAGQVGRPQRHLSHLQVPQLQRGEGQHRQRRHRALCSAPPLLLLLLVLRMRIARAAGYLPCRCCALSRLCLPAAAAAVILAPASVSRRRRRW